ncbi:hypothetical protein TNCV_3287391 [Trichonephila clavipes]|nr:hypothetical protein TNCV_3287391 [Trichonephila clavipes]
MVQRNREKEQKEQHINGIENHLLKGCTKTGVRNYEQKSFGRHRIPKVLEDFWHVTYPTGSYRYLSDDTLNCRYGRLEHQTLHVISTRIM